LTGPELYAGRLVQDRTGQWNLMAFHNIDEDGRFIGALSEPIPVAWDEDRLALAVNITTT
jgi:beta-fructofuranosidase